MAKLDVYSTTGKKTSTLTVSDKIFSAKVNSILMAQAVRVYLANQRQASSQTKTRSQINVSKKKIWRQKGTGRARHGSRNAPIFVGGAKAHGPTGQQNYSATLPKKMKRLSLFGALTTQLKDKNILAVSGLETVKPKTKAFDQLFQKLIKNPDQVLLLIDKSDPSVVRGAGNLPYLSILPAQTLNTYAVLRAHKLIFTKEAVRALEKHYAG